MVESLLKKKELLVKEALTFDYISSNFDSYEVEQIKKVIETISTQFDKQYEKYVQLIAQEAQLVEDIDNSGTFSPEMDDPDDPFNDQMQLIERKLENEKDLRDKLLELQKYISQLNIPYFGSLKESNKNIPKYIGKSTLLDDDFKVLVSDWRSPLGSKYYQYRFEEGGSVKRIYSIQSGILEEVFEVKSGNKEADIYLLKELANKKGGSLTDIVNTIQSQQDKIIRVDNDKPMIIQGVAGSGKTTILFHRISYLMFNDAKKFSRKNILLIVPTKLFKKYTEDIKISLGIGDINVMTYSEFLKQYLKLFFPFVIKPNDVKSFIDIISEFKKRELEIVKEKLSVTGKQSNQLFSEYLKISKNEKLTFREKIEMISEIFELDEQILSKINESFSPLEIFLELIGNHELKENILRYRIYLDKLKKEETSSKGVRKILLKPLIRFTPEEINQLVKIKIYLEGNAGYKYNLIAIDEAQNLSKESIDIVSKFVTNSNIILAGDLAQRVSEKGVKDWKEISFFDQSNYFEMDTTYRISKEIVEYLNSCGFAKNYLPNAVISKPGTLSIYEACNVGDFKKLVRDLDLQSENLAIICNGVEMKEKVVKLFEGEEILDKLGISVHIIDILQSKGLEFESVITIGFSNPDNFKYIASTRTLNNLIDIKSLLFN